MSTLTRKPFTKTDAESLDTAVLTGDLGAIAAFAETREIPAADVDAARICATVTIPKLKREIAGLMPQADAEKELREIDHFLCGLAQWPTSPAPSFDWARQRRYVVAEAVDLHRRTAMAIEAALLALPHNRSKRESKEREAAAAYKDQFQHDDMRRRGRIGDCQCRPCKAARHA